MIVCTNEELFARDSLGRTALDWARLTNNLPAITLLSQEMRKAINLERIKSVGLEKSIAMSIRETNRSLTKALHKALDDRNIHQIRSLLSESNLTITREQVELLATPAGDNEVRFLSYRQVNHLSFIT